MTFFSLPFQRLRAVCAGVGIALFITAPAYAQDENSAARNSYAATEAITERDAILRCIQSLPPAPAQRVSAPLNLSADLAPVLPPTPALITAPDLALAAGPEEPLRSAITRLNLSLPLPDARIVISKAARTLELFRGDLLVKTYHVALGSNPDGRKQSEGDGRTPEGQFYICTRNAKNSAFHIFLGLSYPALPDATRAVNQKIITWRDYQIIRQRLASRGAPLWETRLGGWVGIHGGSDGSFAMRKKQARASNDWTAGCIALTNKEIAEIHAATILGTPVLIRP